MKNGNTQRVVLYEKPGGIFEEEALTYLRSLNNSKPMSVYISGKFAEARMISSGHTGTDMGTRIPVGGGHFSGRVKNQPTSNNHQKDCYGKITCSKAD